MPREKPEDTSIQYSDYERFVKLYEEYKSLVTIEEKIQLWDREGLTDFLHLIDHDKKLHSVLLHLTPTLPPNTDLMSLYGMGKDGVHIARYAMSINQTYFSDFEELKVNYWKSIANSSIAEEFLNKQLGSYTSSMYSNNLFNEKECFTKCFSMGYDDSVSGRSLQLSNAIEYLNTFKMNRYLNIGQFGEGIEVYWWGFTVAQFKGFLLDQKKRLEKGEDIRYPANEIIVQIVQENEKKNQRVDALLYFYRQQSGEYPTFNRQKLDCVALGKELGYGKGNRFYNTFTEVRNDSQRKYFLTEIELAIELMDEYPKAKELAQQELNKIQPQKK